MISAIQAVNEVVYAKLNNASALWGVRVQPLTIASAQLTRPYVVFFPSSNQRRMSTPPNKVAEVLLSVKAVADNLADALTAQQAITELLDDSGDQDVDPRLPYNAGWRLLTVTEERAIDVQEQFSGAVNIFHSGHLYRIVMERR